MIKIPSDVQIIIISFLNNLKDIMSWKSVCRYNMNICHRAYMSYNKSLPNIIFKLSIIDNPRVIINGQNILYLLLNYNISDEYFRYMPNIIELLCDTNTVLTDNALQYIPKLKVLHCGHNINFTDIGLSYVTSLTTLHCGYWESDFTDIGLSKLTNLKVLNCSNNIFFTDLSLFNLKKLEVLFCSNNNNFTNTGMISLTNLIILHCGKNIKLSYSYIKLVINNNILPNLILIYVKHNVFCTIVIDMDPKEFMINMLKKYSTCIRVL
jgi:hypothetical protein